MALCLAMIGGPAGAQTDDDLQSLVRGNSAFALELYRELSKTNGNLFLSPYSISNVLAVAMAGARANTEEQMARVLRFELAPPRLHGAFGSLALSLRAASAESTGLVLRIANGLWVQAGLGLRSGYLSLVGEYYAVVPGEYDFIDDAVGGREQINRWVRQRTDDRVAEFLPVGIPDGSTRLLLVNATYFKGQWMTPFDDSQSTIAPFWTTADLSIDVPMMVQEGRFRFMENREWRLLELPYEGGRMAMLLLLPVERGVLKQLEQALTVDVIRSLQEQTEDTSLRVIIPRFSIRSEFSLADALAALGMVDPFMAHSDFSGISESVDLHLTDVLHSAFVDVDEEGTVAAAATGLGFSTRAFVRPPVFRADRPFAFAIQDRESGSILFLGRVANPLDG